MEQCRKLAKGAMKDKSALQCLKSMVESQGGEWPLRGTSGSFCEGAPEPGGKGS